MEKGEVLEVKVERIEKDVERHNGDIKEIRKEVSDLKTSDADLRADLRNLIKKLDSLTDLYVANLVGICGVLIGFFIWYVQHK